MGKASRTVFTKERLQNKEKERVGIQSVQFDLVVVTGLGEVFWKQDTESRI